MKRCPKCGEQVEDRVKFCPECGSSIPTFEAPSLASEKTSYGEVSSEIDELLGEIVANYRVEERIGHGGMGVVYRAVHPTIEKTVAIKFLPPSFSKSPRFVSRFQREAKAMAKLNHKNIVHIQNMGTHRDLYYLIMEYVPGRTVADILHEKGRIQWQDVIQISKQVLQALKIAHTQGMLHRDIKPSNILVTDDGNVKVADFGLVKMMGIGDEISIGEARSKMSISSVSDARHDGVALTIEGSPIGTFDYMSPEQYRGEGDLDARTDIYSFGMTLYKMLTGRLARGRAKGPSQLFPEIPSDLDDICFTCIEEEPIDRYQDAESIVKVLASLIENTKTVVHRTDTKATRQGPTRKRYQDEQSHRKSAERIPKAGQKKCIDMGYGVYLNLVWIPPGDFVMGSPTSERGRLENEGPRHRVKITNGFWMGKYDARTLKVRHVLVRAV